MVGGFDAFEEGDAALFDLVAAGAVEGLIGVEISIDLFGGKSAHPEGGDVGVCDQAALGEDGQGGDQLVALTGEGEELISGAREISGLAEELIAEGEDLVAGDDDGIGGGEGEALRFGLGECFGEGAGGCRGVLEAFFVDQGGG